MKYRHIPSGIIVHSDSKLPEAVYERVDEKAGEKPTPRKRVARKPKEA